MKGIRASLFLSVLFISFACSSQSQKNAENKVQVGGRCEDCDLMYAGMPATIGTVDTSIGWKEGKGEKFIINGTVFKNDGKTPAKDVILYYYHTDHTGKYIPRDDMNQQAKRHGYLRGWVKTDSRGRYTIYTIRPMHYPNETFAAHVHVTVKEPDYNEYYIDEWVFDDDKYLTAEVRNRNENRGGSGIMHAEKQNGIWVTQQNVICGKNIPSYPKQ